MVKIFIDPGHGGADPGTSGYGMQEKNLTLQIALTLRNILVNEYKGVSVLLSRTSDQTVSLTERTNAANNWGADYYLSIHINAGGGRGLESYVLRKGLSHNSQFQQLSSLKLGTSLIYQRKAVRCKPRDASGHISASAYKYSGST